MYEMFKFYALHQMWDLADKYIAAIQEQKNLPPVLPSRKCYWLVMSNIIDTCHLQC